MPLERELRAFNMIKHAVIGSVFLFTAIFAVQEYRQRYTHRGKLHNHRNGITHRYGEGFSIDLYAYASDIIGWNPGFKVTFSVLTMILSIVFDNPYVSIAVILSMAYVTVVKGGMEVKRYLSILAIPISFILLGTITIAVDFSKEPVGQYNIYIGLCYVYTSVLQLKKMLFLMLKAFAAVSALQMMTLSTPSNEIITVLRRAYIPKLIIELMNLIYRFIFILVDTHRQMKNSALARNGYCDFKTSCFTFGSIAVNMLVLSLKKANAYYNAMEARCYDGELLFLEEDKKIEWEQLVAATVFLAFLFLLWGLM
jgi:cobalt/nickel transport system permease protein